MSGDLEGKAALVTGGAMGIGRAAAEALASQGARVAVVDVADCDPVEGGVAVKADVSRGEAVQKAVDETVAAFGHLHIAVCAAGIQRYGSVVEAPDSQWDEVIAVNLKQMFLVGKHAVPAIEASGGGAVCNVASVQGLVAQRGVAVYAASKGGVIALTRAMAVDHAPAVRVNCVCPGSVDTPMLRSSAELFAEGRPVDDVLRSWGAMHPMERIAQPNEVGEAIAWLCGPRASFVTGAALVVDGGLISRLGGT